MGSMFRLWRGNVYASCDEGMFMLDTQGWYDNPTRWIWQAMTADQAAEIRRQMDEDERP